MMNLSVRIAGVAATKVGATVVRGAALLSAATLMGAVLPGTASAAADRPYVWQQGVMKGGGFITGLYFHPTNARVLYMRTDMGGAYRLDYDANRWVPIQDGVGFDDYSSLHGGCSIALDPTDDNKVYMFTGMYTTDWGTNGAILRSDDRGATWKRTDLPFKGGGNMSGRWCADRLALDPNQPSTLYVGTPSGLVYKSTDSAVTWNQLTGFPKIANNKYGVVAIEIVGGKPGEATQTVYAGVNRNGGGATLFRSDDAGATWAEVSGGPGTEKSRYLNKIVKDRDGNLLLVYVNSSDSNMNDARPKQGWLYKYDTTAKKWTTLHTTNGYGIAAVAVDPQNTKVLLITAQAKWSGNIDLWRSEDGGAKWTQVAIKRTGEPPYVTDGWPYPHWSFDIDIAPDNSNHVMISGVPGIYRTTEGTQPRQTWAFYNDGMEQTCVNDVVSPPSGSAQVYSATYDISGFKHDDLTVSPPDFAPEMDGSVDIDFAELAVEKMVRTTTNQPHGAFSSDAGVTWTAFMPTKGMGRGDTVAISADGEAIVWSSSLEGGPNVHRSTDGGQSWSGVVGLPKVTLLAADRVNANTIYAYVRSEGKLYRSTDKGVSFTLAGSNLSTRGKKIVVNPTAEGDVWLGADDGVFHSTDGGATWSKLEGVRRAIAIGLGKARSAEGYPAIYIVGTVGEAKGIHRSDDAGVTWTEISDPDHQFGLVHTITGDPRRYGRVYLGTNGRGLFYGDPRE